MIILLSEILKIETKIINDIKKIKKSKKLLLKITFESLWKNPPPKPPVLKNG